MTTNMKNTHPMAAVISSAMSDEKTALNRSAAMTLYMYGDDANYSLAALSAIMKLEDKELTKAVDSRLSDMSPAFAKVRNELDHAAKMRKESKRDADKRIEHSLDFDLLNKQVRAVRKMFKLALTATVGLRYGHVIGDDVNPSRVAEAVASKKRPGQINVTYFRKVGGKESTTIPAPYSVDALIRFGDKALEKLVKKAKAAPRAAKNPLASFADPAKAIAAQMTSLAASGKRPALESFADEVETNLRDVLAELAIAAFFDGATFDDKAHAEWLAQIKARAAARPNPKVVEDKTHPEQAARKAEATAKADAEAAAAKRNAKAA